MKNDNLKMRALVQFKYRLKKMIDNEKLKQGDKVELCA